MSMFQLDHLNNENYRNQIAKADKGLGRITRRLDQFLQVFRSKDIENPEQIFAAIKKRYATSAEIDFYKDYIHRGFFKEELIAVKHCLEQLRKTQPRSLVIGMGAGRESFAFEKAGFVSDGIDNCPQMVKAANEMKLELESKSNYWQQDILENPEMNHKYDVILHSPGINGHIPTQKSRSAFLKASADNLHENGFILFTPEIWPLKRFSVNWIISHILKFRWGKKQKWLLGDTIRSFFGNHNDTKQVMYYHYYQSSQEVEEELMNAGLKGFCLPECEIWVCQKTNKSKLS